MNLVKTLKRQDPVEPIKVDARANGIHLRIGSPGEFLAGIQVWGFKGSILAGVRPGGRGPVLLEKGPKQRSRSSRRTMKRDAPSGLIGWDGRKLGKSGPTRGAQIRPAGK